MKTPIIINTTQLIDLLNGVQKGTFVNLMYQVIVRMNKTNNPYYNQVYKQTSGNFGLGNSYENRVTKDGEKEGHNMDTFEVESNRTGEHISKVVLFNSKLNKHYVQIEFHPEIKPNTKYIYQNNEIDKTLFQDYRTKLSESKKQPHTNKTIFLSLTLDNLKEISLQGERYIHKP